MKSKTSWVDRARLGASDEGVLHVSRRVLRNHLPVVYVHLPHVHSASLAFAVRGGPRYETPSTNGLSHVTEHLLFRGTEAHPSSLDFHCAVEALGGETNGQTQRDAVTAHVTVPPRATAEAAGLLAELCVSPLLTGLDVEREVIIEELLDSKDSDGRQLDPDTLSRAALWPDHPMGMSVCGPLDNVRRFTEAEARRWHERLFVGDNAVLVVAGPMPPGAVHPSVIEAFEALPAGRRRPEPAAPRAPRWPSVQVQPTDDAQVTALLTFPAPAERDPRFFVMQLLQRLLDDGFGARLRQAICEQRGLAYALSVTPDAYADCAALDIELSCAPEKVVAAVAQAFAVLDELARGPLPAAELDRVKRRYEAALEFCLDDPEELCTWFTGTALMGTGDGYHHRLNEVHAVRPEAVQQLARDMFTLDRVQLTLVGPVERSQASHLARLIGRNPRSTVWCDRAATPAPLQAAS